ncbi:DUF4843 domain-containing protein [Sphingobacterium griseoflavum]|uniref:DUF4843 domain-containing protein n=1 Tax=Sphingobacterium griseoflavum TaxID=1474952 RepID=A0ABQ3HWX4_9SPHI|nr:DUF4843 domain-containing protein [Sphingobacterium griseoflavum]GHE35810.1 hypothetical protein GCM10017764_18910 [Sphingobacterium griseoflavum]
MKSYFLLFFTLLIWSACDTNNGLLEFDTDQSYIYFAYPNANTRAAERYMDSVYYSFALDADLQRKQKTIAVPIRVGGMSSSYSRTYAYIVEDYSRYDPQTVEFSSPVIGANKFVDTLFIKFQRSKQMESEPTVLYLRMQGNNEFVPGNVYNQKLKIIIDDILNEPLWWNTWKNYFGPYQKEIFQQWMQIYYFGADPSPDLTTAAPGPVYYWNNMPTSAFSSWYPVTFNYIQVLKQYFIDHPVYPEGDRTKERIQLP